MNMKNVIMMIIMAVALVALPAMAQDWQSTSTMQGSGSAYSAQVTAVGAAEVTEMATTTSSTPNNGPHRAKKGDFGPGQDGGYKDPNSPIGDAWPMLLFAALFAIVITIKKHKKVMMKKNLKTVLFIAVLLLSNGAWADLVTVPAGRYYFDCHNVRITNIKVFGNNGRSYMTFNSSGHCQNSELGRNDQAEIYPLTGGESITYFYVDMTSCTIDGGFYQVCVNGVWGSWVNYDASGALPTSSHKLGVQDSKDVYLGIVDKDGHINWSSNVADLPVCSGLSNPNLTLSYGPNGTITTAKADEEYISLEQAVAVGASVHVVATPDTGYAFYGWVDGNSELMSTDADYTFLMPSSSYSLTALFYADNIDPSISGCSGCYRVSPE
jgi:hypothetical protein